MLPSDPAAAILTIDLDSVAANYRLLRGRASGADCAAVVKADAYGLGVRQVAPALARAGCTRFFVADMTEGLALRRLLPNAEVYVFNGVPAGAADSLADERLIPVLNSLEQVDGWSDVARRRGGLPAVLHVDTGMNRLGLPAYEVEALALEPQRLAGIELRYLMSHLACADEPEHLLNGEQLSAFIAARTRLPEAPASFANSPGIFLGAPFHFDLLRPGAALYGLAPRPDACSPMAQVVKLQGRILQVREIDRSATVGYGATQRVARGARLATVGVGYADGYLRSLSNRGTADIGGVPVPVVGRVSMDLITLDVSAVAPETARPGAYVDLIGERNPPDALAAEAGTIGYEILTSLGQRYHRIYVGGA